MTIWIYIYVSENLDMPPLSKIKEMSQKMGNSPEQVMLYKKYDSSSEEEER